MTELDLDPRRGSILVRRGKGGRRREVGIDDRGFEHSSHRFAAGDDARRPVVLRHQGPHPRARLGVTSIDLQGIDPGEIIETIHARRPPMIPASAHLALPPGR